MISRTLAPLVSKEPGLFQIIVVCNACTDATVEVASSFAEVLVLKSDIPSKPNALNIGDRHASVWPRIYLDADIVAASESLVATARALARPGVHAARPAAQFDVDGAGLLVRAYYRTRQKIPSLQRAMWGAGVYGLSKTGHERLGRFPELKGDDLWVDRLFDEEEKTVVAVEPVRVRVPRTFRALVAISRRNVSGAREPGPSGPVSSAGGMFREVIGSIRSPRAVFDASVYILVALLARAGRRAEQRWERDDTSRS
ncbi:hypothetical protein GCM10009776_14780 [Microbacterium deminutum]|uniref:Glycosyltransferase 2-like domain-containing protein n=1 Tax=Microbacterium deminutum TaxID=344164 RepID=A0ABN2QL15_9MICO